MDPDNMTVAEIVEATRQIMTETTDLLRRAAAIIDPDAATIAVMFEELG